MCTTHTDIITNINVQFESIILIHVVFGKTQTCIIFCFIFTKELMEHCSMVKGRGLHKLWGGLSITSFGLTGPAHCPPQRQRWIFKRGEHTQLRSRECINEGRLRGFVSPLMPSTSYYTISQLMCLSSRYHLTEGLNLTLVLCCIHPVHEAIRM